MIPIEQKTPWRKAVKGAPSADEAGNLCVSGRFDGVDVGLLPEDTMLIRRSVSVPPAFPFNPIHLGAADKSRGEESSIMVKRRSAADHHALSQLSG